MKLKQVLVIAIIAMFLLVPFASAKQEVADSVKQDKINEKVTDKTKGVAKEITSKDSEIKGKVTVTDSDSSKYSVEKKSKTEISISKNEAKGEHTKSKVTFAKEDLQKIDVDGDKLYGVLHIADDGSTSHDVYTESQLIAGTEMVFSENIVNGYSGYIEQTYTGVTSGTVLNTPDVSGSDYYITTSVNGSVPTYSVLNTGVKANLPQSSTLSSYWDFTNVSNSNVSSIWGGPTAKITNGTVANNKVSFIGTGRIANPHINTSSFSISMHVSMPASVLTSTNYYLYQMWGDSATLYYNPATDTIYAYNGATYISASANINDGIKHNIVETHGNGRVKLYVDNNLLINSSSTLIATTSKYFLFSKWSGSNGWIGNATDIAIYSSVLSAQNRSILYTKSNGISIKPFPSSNFTPYNVASGVEKIIDTDATCTGLEYIDTTGGTHTVTVRIYFTEDITKTTETKGAVYQNVSIIHTKQNATASVGTIAYELDPLYSGDPVLTSNNTNATVSRNDTHVIISTGLIKQGQSFSYAVSVPDDHDHGIHLNQLMKWVGTGWDFVSTAPEDWDDYIGDQIEVTVS